MKRLLQLALLCLAVGLCLAQSTKPQSWQKAVHVPLGAVPTSPTAVWTADTDVQQVVLTNTNASTQVTVTVQDAAGNVFVKALLNGVSTQNNTFEAVFPNGLMASGGVTWSASGTGVNGYIVGRQ